MSKNSKTLKVIAGAVFAFAVAFSSTASAAITSNLRQGSRGAQVMELQQFLNNCSAETMVAATGPGSKGMETSFFGPATRRAVIAFQNKFGVATTSRSAGLVGPATRAAIAAGCGTSTGTGSGSTTQTGPITAMLASTNPGSGTLVQNQAMADLAQFTFNGSGTINTISLKRLGVSADATLEDVFLFEGNTRLTDSATVSAGGMVTFAGLNIPVMGSKTISVRSDIGGSSSGQTVGIQLVSLNGNSVNISGNLHTIASYSDIATVSIASATGSVTEPGADQNVWGGSLTISRDVVMNRLSIRQVGSIPANEINNFKLLVDGVQVASASNMDSSNYVNFNINPGRTLTSGTRVLKVMADVVGGSNRTVEFDLRGSYDIGVVDSQLNVGVEATGTFPFGPASSTISTGSLSVIKAMDSASGNITNAANDVSFGKFTFTAYGEAVKVETLTVGFDWSGTDANADVRNVRILANGSQVGSTTTVPAVDAHASGTQFTTNFTVNPGSPVTVEIRGDVYDNDSAGDEFASNDTLQVAIIAGSSNAVRQSSLGSFAAPTATQTGNVLTIKEGGVSMAKTSNYTNQSTVAPKSAYRIASFVLSGNSTEAINVNTLDLDIAVTDNSGGATATIADVTDVYVKYGNNQTSIKSTVTATGNTWSPSFTLGVNETMTVDVFASFNTDLVATDTIVASLEVSGTAAQSATSQTTGVITGQTITMGAASITASLDASSPVAQLVDDSGTVVTAAYKFVTITDSYTITDVNVDLASTSAVSNVKLMDGTTVLATRPAATDITFSGLNISVPANTTKILTVAVDLSPIGVSMGTTSSSLITTLDVSHTLARNSQGSSAAVSGTDAAGNAVYAYKAIPTVTVLPLQSTTLVGGTVTLAKFSVSSNGTGTIAWKELLLEINKAAAPIITSPTLWNADTGTQITAAALYQNSSEGSDTDCDASDTSCEIVITVGTKADDDVVEQVSGTKNYEIRATVSGTLADGNYVATKIDRNTGSYAASAAFTSNDAGTGANSTSFTWSDESASSTADTGVSTWQNDYLVKNLPITWTLSR